MTAAGRERLLRLLCVLLCAGVLALDLALPLGVAGGVPYVLVVLLALRSNDERVPLFFAFVASLLTLAGMFLSEPAAVYWMVIANRGLALFAIWVTALLGLSQRYAEHRALESEGRFQMLADQTPIMIWRAGSRGDWNFISRGWLEFTGRVSEEEEGDGWLDGIHPRERDAVAREYVTAVAQRTPLRIACRLLAASGEYRHVVIHGAPQRLAGGLHAGFVGSAIDVHAQYEAEQRLKETMQKAFHREKMASIGMLTSGLLHEIGNPVAALSGVVQALIADSDRAGDGGGERAPKRREYLQMLHDELERLARITRSFGDLASLSGSERELRDLGEIVERTCWLLRHDERMARITLDLDLDRTLPALPLVSDLLIQMLINLLVNAIDACAGNEGPCRIVVATRAVEGRVVLEVSDDGPGIPPEVLAHVNEPFFTTKPAGKGLGLGLTLCHSLAAELGASLRITSGPGAGTSAVVTFAEAEQDAMAE